MSLSPGEADYYLQGGVAVPADEIPALEGVRDRPPMPSNAAAQLAKLQQWLSAMEDWLAVEVERYEALRLRGIEALEPFERRHYADSPIEAWAAAISIRYASIHYKKGLIAHITGEIRSLAGERLFV